MRIFKIKQKIQRNIEKLIKNFFRKANNLNHKIERKINHKSDYKLNYKKGIVSSPETYLKNCTEYDEFEVKKVKIIDGVGHATCKDFDGKNNCTLTALYNLLLYYRDKRNLKKIPKEKEKLYDLILKSGRRHLYTRRRGMPVYMNSFFVTDVVKRRIKISRCKGKMTFFPGNDKVLEFLDKDIPFIYSLASKPYFNHSVVVYGYRIYKEKLTGKEYVFLLVHDGWAHVTRFIPWKNLDRKYIACMTYII